MGCIYFETPCRSSLLLFAHDLSNGFKSRKAFNPFIVLRTTYGSVFPVMYIKIKDKIL